MVRPVVLFAATLAIVVAACSPESESRERPERVASLGEWCETQPTGRVDSTNIRAQIAEMWDVFLVSEGAKALGVSADSQSLEEDSLIQELRSARVMGAWAEGTTLWFAAGMMVPPAIYPEHEPGTPEHSRAMFSDYLRTALQSERPSEPEAIAARCMWTSIPAFFDRWMLVDGEEGMEIPFTAPSGDGESADS